MLGGMHANSVIPARSLILISLQPEALSMANKVNGNGGEIGADHGTQKSPLEIAKQMAERTSRNPKEIGRASCRERV